MPSSPITKKITLPDNWVHLQKTMIPDTKPDHYWSVWYDVSDTTTMVGTTQGTAWLMCCQLEDNPSINDNWYHVEDLDEICRNVLTAIESVYGVSFQESIWVEMGAEEVFPATQVSPE